jgi:hypothetical protein
MLTGQAFGSGFNHHHHQTEGCEAGELRQTSSRILALVTNSRIKWFCERQCQSKLLSVFYRKRSQKNPTVSGCHHFPTANRDSAKSSEQQRRQNDNIAQQRQPAKNNSRRAVLSRFRELSVLDLILATYGRSISRIVRVVAIGHENIFLDRTRFVAPESDKLGLRREKQKFQ